jgi:acyl-homoserine-lactone acylase
VLTAPLDGSSSYRGSTGSGRRRGAFSLLALACALVCVLCAASGASAYKASLTRTTGGVANIEASTLAGGGFGTGYAQGQDGICTLAEEYLTLSGERSAFFGPASAGVDLYWKSLIQNETIEKLLALPYPQGPSAQAKELATGFAAGYDKYLSDVGGPAGITDPRCAGAAWVRPIKEIDVWRLMYKLDTKAGGAPRAALIAAASPPAGQPLARRAGAAATQRATAETQESLAQDGEISLPGSNGLGIGSEDAANGGGLVLSNPHFPWVGGERFWESHVNVPGVYDVIGASLWGSPLINIGHNQHVGWTHTVSTNITTTNWTLKLVPGHTTQYLVDGNPVQMTFQDVTVQVLEGGKLVPKSHRFYYSKYGPIIASPAWTTTTATAFDDANFTNLRSGDQWIKIGESTSSQQLIKSEEEVEGIPWVNTIGSDDKGNAFYTEIAVTPNLPNAYLNSACNLSPTKSTAGPFDGSKTECELGSDPDSVSPGIFGASNEPKLVRKDYAENSNNSFWLANSNQLLTGFSPALGNENANPGMRSQTGIDMVNQRMGTLNAGVPTDGLSGTPGFTTETLQNSWTSYRAMPAERALPGLREICENAVKNSGGVINKVNVSAACPILNAYDSTAKLNSPGGWLFNRWWASAPTTNASFWVNPWIVSNPVYTPNTLNTSLATSQNALATAVTDLETRGIPLNASFGQVQYTQRATKIPIPGCSDGSNCFAVINSSYDNATAKTSAVNGSSSSIVMFTELDPVNGPTTKGLLTYSQSEDITSPFYEDQTKRFSNDNWITLPWTPEQVSESQISAPQTLSTEPAVTEVAPNSGPAAGGTSVTITGAGFGEASDVKFGASSAASFTVNSSTSITATSPAGSGTVDVTVTTPEGSSPTSASDQFTYVAAPAVSSVSPNAGAEAGGTSVTITGTDLTGASDVKFGASSAASYTVNSPTSITATSPAGSGTVDVTVITPGGTSATSAADQFSYVPAGPAPKVKKVSPKAGPAAGGTSVTITGTGFTGATSVDFGSTSAASVTVNSATSITAVSPASSSGSVHVTVTTPNGTSASVGADRFQFQAPTITELSPNSGSVTGGTSVTITGTGFALGAGTKIQFGSKTVSASCSSITTCTAVSPAHKGAGAVKVKASVAGKHSAASPAAEFTYTP